MKYLLLLLIGGLLCVSTGALAQTPETDPTKKPDDQLTKDEAEARINQFSASVNDLKSRLDAVTVKVNDANSELEKLNADNKKCNDEMYALVGATEADVQKFREKIGRIENRLRELNAMPDDQLNSSKGEVESLGKELDGIRGQKIAVLPEFYNKVVDMGAQLKGLRNRIGGMTKSYTVGTWKQDKDCLWNIASKEQTYNDPFMWPKIWQANTDKIRNPDIIYPGQVLTLPSATAKTNSDMRAERLYFRNKRAGRRTYSREQPLEQTGAGSGGK